MNGKSPTHPFRGSKSLVYVFIEMKEVFFINNPGVPISQFDKHTRPTERDCYRLIASRVGKTNGSRWSLVCCCNVTFRRQTTTFRILLILLANGTIGLIRWWQNTPFALIYWASSFVSSAVFCESRRQQW